MIQDPRNRFLGLYYNKDDPRLVVPKRTFRPGWTLNFAHPYALPALVFGFLLAVGPAILLERSGYATPLRMAVVIALSIALLVVLAQRGARLP